METMKFRRCRKLLKKIRKRMRRVKTTERDPVRHHDNDLVRDHVCDNDLVETDLVHDYEYDYDYVNAPTTMLLLVFLFYLNVVAF